MKRFAALLALVFFCAGAPYAQEPTGLRVGEGVAAITPPNGTELAGFHKPPGQERRAKGVRQESNVRALMIAADGKELVLVSVDVCAVSLEFCRAASAEVSKRTGVPAENVRITATHTHSMPTLRFIRQWGGMPADYAGGVSGKIADAVELARKDLAPAELRLGKERVVGGNFNRTGQWKADPLFTETSTEDERWLDTTLHALYFVREAPRKSLLWYQFSAHAVCFTDDKSGPDWPGKVSDKVKEAIGLAPSFLPGHTGDVNPGDGTPWIGDPDKTTQAVSTALLAAVKSARPVKVDVVRQARVEWEVPLDVEGLREELELYRGDPSQCEKGEWVDAGFAKAWFDDMSTWDRARTVYRAPVTAVRLGDVALLFHPGELYSYYGLAIRRDSPYRDTLVIGYTDDLIGYLPDPKAYKAREYAAVVTPKALGLPRFKPQAAKRLTATALELLKKL
jgi:neutral/alkaline ceramidase-like enzyme